MIVTEIQFNKAELLKIRRFIEVLGYRTRDAYRAFYDIRPGDQIDSRHVVDFILQYTEQYNATFGERY